MPNTIEEQTVIREGLLERYFLPALILLSLILSLSALLQSGFSGDDAMNSQVSAHLILEGESLGGAISGSITDWLHAQGRFFPFSTYVLVVFNYVHSIFIYKLLCLLVVCLGVISFGYLLERTLKSKALGLVSILLVPLLFQFRVAHDPILSFCFLLPLVFLEFTLSLIFFQKYIDRRQTCHLFLSLICYCVSLLTYEITYVFFVLHFLLAYHLSKDLRKAGKLSLPFLVAAAAAIGVAVYLRSGMTAFAPSYTIHFSPLLYFETLLKQVSGAFPLVNPSRVFSHGAFFQDISAGDIVSTALFVYLLRRLSLVWAEESIAKNFGFLIYFGGAMATLPALMISLSPKHQSTLLWGVPYLPVYVQYFGILLLLMGIYGKFLSVFPGLYRNRGVNLALCIVLGFINLANLQNHRSVVEKFNSFTYYPRVLLGDALSLGLLDGVPENSVIVARNSFVWDNICFYYMMTLRKFEVINEADYVRRASSRSGADYRGFLPEEYGRKVYIIHYQASSKDSGYLFFAEVKKTYVIPGSSAFSQVNAGDLRIFKRGPGTYNCIVAKVRGESGAAGEWRTRTVSFSGNAVKIKRRGELYGSLLNGETFEFNSLLLGSASPESVHTAKVLEQGGEERLHGAYTPGDWITNEDSEYLPFGWSGNEGAFRWSEGRSARIRFKLRRLAPCSSIKFVIVPQLVRGSQRLELSVNGRKAGEALLDAAKVFTIRFNPGLLAQNATNEIMLSFPDAAAPGNGDQRLLAVALGKAGLFY